MRKLSRRYKALSIVLVVAVIGGLWFFEVKGVCAHSPHDVIDAIELSPGYAQDQTLFIVAVDHLLRSADGGFSWKELINGLDNVDPFSDIALTPSYPSDQTLYVATQGDGVYKSRDGGNSWVSASDGLDSLDIRWLAVHPAYQVEPVVLAAGARGGLYRTANGGESWHLVMADDVTLTALAFFPGTGRAIAGDQNGALFLSEDGGETWRSFYTLPDAGSITALSISPGFSSDQSFYVGTQQGGVFKTLDGGSSFAPVNNGLPFGVNDKYGTFRRSSNAPDLRRPEMDITSLAVSPEYAHDSLLFAAMWNEAIFQSRDGGQTWVKYPTGLTCDTQADSPEYKSPHFRDIRVSPAFASDRTVFLGGFDGLFKSTDGGQQWTQMETLPLGLIKGLALSPGAIDTLSVAITTYGGGAYLTMDQGQTWSINNSGLATTRLSDIVFSPAYPADHTLFSSSRGYLLKSTDQGNSWDKIAVTGKDNNVKPFATVIALSPNFPADHTLYFGSRADGIFRSVDGGQNSASLWDAFGERVTALVVSPAFAADRSLFAGVRGEGVYKSVDAGDAWQPANNGLDFLSAWQAPSLDDVSDKDILLAISPNYGTDQTVFVGSSQGLFKTADGGAIWQEVKNIGAGKTGYVIGLAISPNYANDGMLIVSLKGRGLFQSEDGGETFTAIGSDLISANQSIELIRFSGSYAADHALLAASDEALFRSPDGGTTWAIIHRPVRYENMRDAIQYEGKWSITENDDYSAGSISRSNASRARAILNFIGRGVAWIGAVSDEQGIAHVYLDGTRVTDVDQFAETRQLMMPVWGIADLTPGLHTLMIEVAGDKNPSSTGTRIEIDAFDVLP
ncbi:MAG TPA: hypothetical protein VJG32_11165 [Anaerolineae bacterium]|nr:hypothetical protein [Anaerolineae bacterium]